MEIFNKKKVDRLFVDLEYVKGLMYNDIEVPADSYNHLKDIEKEEISMAKDVYLIMKSRLLIQNATLNKKSSIKDKKEAEKILKNPSSRFVGYFKNSADQSKITMGLFEVILAESVFVLNGRYQNFPKIKPADIKNDINEARSFAHHSILQANKLANNEKDDKKLDK